MTCCAPSALTRCWLAGPAVAMTWAPRSTARATSRPPVTPPAPWTSSCSPARTPSVSPSTCSAVSAGTGKAAAASQLALCGLRASSPAGTISRGAQVPWSRSGTGWVMTASPGAQSLTAWPTASTVPAASTPSAIGGLAPTSQPPVRTNSSQLPTPAALTPSSTSSPASGRSSPTSIIATWSPIRRIPAACISHLHGPFATSASRQVTPLSFVGVVGEQGDLDAVVEVELLEEARDVRLHGGDAHVELATDFGVGLAASDRDGDLALTFGEAVELFAGTTAALTAVGSGHVPDQPAGDRGRQDRFAGRDGPDGADDVRGWRVFEQEAAGAGPQGTQDVVVGVEGREDDDLGRALAAAHDFGGRQAVHSRHANVHQHDAGLVFGDGAFDLAAVGGLADDLNVTGARQQHAEPGADQCVVVDDQHADPLAHDGHGSHACSRKWPRSSSPCSRRPPESVARSVRPSRPAPVPGIFGSAAASAGSGLRTSIVRPCPGAPPRPSSTGAEVACLRALVSASWTILSAWRPIASGTAARSGRPTSACTRIPAARDSSSSPGSAASVGWGGCGPWPSVPSLSTPITVRRSSSAWCALARITAAARATCSGGASGRNSSAPACRLSSEIRWASTSCISRAIRVRSA